MLVVEMDSEAARRPEVELNFLVAANFEGGLMPVEMSC